MKRILVLAMAVLMSGVIAAEEEESPFPDPVPELELFIKEEGTWDVSMEIWPSPGLPPQTSTGVETNTVCCNGLWLLTEFRSQMAGRAFQGHGVYGYDTIKKKYTGMWVDSLQTYLASFEGVYDSSTKTLTMWTDGVDAGGKPVRWRGVTEFKDDSTRIWTAYFPDSSGNERITMRIVYKRRNPASPIAK